MEYVTTDKPVRIDDVTLIPIVCISLDGEDNKTDQFFSGNKEPFAIIVCDSIGIRALDINSAEIPISDLVQKIPDLNDKLNQASNKN